MINNVAVIGAGTMGHGFANNFASHGIKVNLYEAFEEVRKTVKDRIKAELEVMVREDYFTADIIEKTLDNIELFSELEPAVRNVDLVLEATPERLDLKKELFAELDKYCRTDTIFASNTSSLKLFDMTADLPEERKAKVMVAHGYNPGKGFYEYPEETREEVLKDFNRRLIIQLKTCRNYKK